MGKLHGILWEGSDKSVCVYVMNDRWYIRSKSYLTHKRVLKSKAFAKTWEYASHMANALRLASSK